MQIRNLYHWQIWRQCGTPNIAAYPPLLVSKNHFGIGLPFEEKPFWFRKKTQETPVQWAGSIHFGPQTSAEALRNKELRSAAKKWMNAAARWAQLADFVGPKFTPCELGRVADFFGADLLKCP